MAPNGDQTDAAKSSPTQDIGTAEWGIPHEREPNRDNRHWSAKYRDINNMIYPATALVARIIVQKDAWNHPAFFDYADRIMKTDRGQGGSNHLHKFHVAMWEACRARGNPKIDPSCPAPN